VPQNFPAQRAEGIQPRASEPERVPSWVSGRHDCALKERRKILSQRRMRA